MNKKLLALLLAILMVAMSAVAMAEEQVVEEKTSFDITKNYTSSDVKPEATFNFNVTANPTTAPALKIGNDAISGNNAITFSFVADEQTKAIPASDSYTITVPGVGTNGYEAKPAVYTYTISEVLGSDAGMSYDSDSVQVVVTVYNAAAAGQNPDYKTTVAIHKTGEETKQSSAIFDNSFSDNDAKLTVTKKLEGKSADTNDKFDITVTFTAADGKTLTSDAVTTIVGTGVSVEKGTTANSYVIKNIGHNDYVTFENIPAGTTYAVVETDNTGSVTEKAYTASYDTNATGTMTASTTLSTTVTNKYDGTIDTGVSTDTMPYILLMAFVAILAVAFVAKKRSVNE